MNDQELDWSDQVGSAPEAYQDFLVPGMFAPFAETLLEDTGVAPGARVLDVACGTGVVTRLAAHRAGAAGAVTGVDMMEPMLAVARAQPAEDGAAPITYVQGDAAELPVEDGAFDVVTCHHGLQFFPDRVAALREARRALAPGGTLAVGCWSAPESAPTFQALIEALGRHMGDELGAAMSAPFALGDPDALRTAIEEAGFREIDVHQDTLEVSFTAHEDFAPRALAAGPLAAPFAAAPPETRAAIAADVAVALSRHATPDGGVRAPMTSTVAIARA